PIKNLTGIWKSAMEIIKDGIENLKSAWKKTSGQQLFHELESEYGFPRATCCPESGEWQVEGGCRGGRENFGFLKSVLTSGTGTYSAKPQVNSLTSISLKAKLMRK
ncbi:MAG: hypothetical protein ACNA7I_02845, partial [Candidatus Methanoperedens sp.]